MAISMLKIRRPLGRLIFNMGIAIPGKTVFLIETAPWVQYEAKELITGIEHDAFSSMDYLTKEVKPSLAKKLNNSNAL